MYNPESMTSAQALSRVKDLNQLEHERRITNSPTPVSQRKGIFQKFSENLVPHYYTVQCSSDSDGNITGLDVKREKFNDDVRGGSEESDCEDSDDLVLADVRSKRYRLRKRIMKKHRDDEFDTMMCAESSDEGMTSYSDAYQGEYSSDDETYDVTTDNWAYVRCGKKKPQESPKNGPKKSGSAPQKTSANKLSKLGSLRVRLRSRFLPKKKTGRKNGTMTARKTKFTTQSTSNSASSSPSKSITSSPSKSITSSPSKTAGVPGKKSRLSSYKSKTMTSLAKTITPISNVINSYKKGHNSTSSMQNVSSPQQPTLQQAMKSENVTSTVAVTSLPVMSASIKRLRRCGYNPTTPRITEIRHIRRRQLKHNPKCDIDDENSSDGEFSPASSGSENSIVISPRVVRGKFKRIKKDSLATSSGHPTSGETPKIPTSNDVIATPTGKGIKLLIRRQSVDAKSARAPQLEKPGLKEEKLDTKENIKKPTLPDPKPLSPTNDTRELPPADKQTANKQATSEKDEKNNSEDGADDGLGENEDGMPNQKTDEVGRKKKLKKRRKKGKDLRERVFGPLGTLECNATEALPLYTLLDKKRKRDELGNNCCK